MSRTYALCNQKGGVGKSTTTFHLARAAVNANRRVLVVDLDPQGNLTNVATAEPVGEDEVGVADVLSSRAVERMDDVIVAGLWSGLSVAPTVGETLGTVRDELVITGAGRESRLRNALDEVRDNYDLILIDCPPSLDQLTINGLSAADAALIVTHSRLFSVNGLARLLTTIEDVRRHYHEKLAISGVIINQHERRTVSGNHWLGEVGEAAAQRGLSVLSPAIPKRAVIADAMEAARGLDQWGSTDATALGTIYSTYLSVLEDS